MASNAQNNANLLNAQLSTGPSTDEGKAKVSKNALKTGLTGHTVLLPADDAELYAKHVESFRARYNPVGDAETEAVQSIADSAWRLARIPSLEANIWAVAQTRLAGLHQDEAEPSLRARLIEGEILIAFERQFRNLALQETRLRRQREKDEATLKQLQSRRITEAENRLQSAALAYIEAVAAEEHNEFDLGRFGFEFSLAEIELRALTIRPNLFDSYFDEMRAIEEAAFQREAERTAAASRREKKAA